VEVLVRNLRTPNPKSGVVGRRKITLVTWARRVKRVNAFQYSPAETEAIGQLDYTALHGP
jgi:hypothetical protein